MEEFSWEYIFIVAIGFVLFIIAAISSDDSNSTPNTSCPRCGRSLYSEDYTLEHSRFCPECGHRLS